MDSGLMMTFLHACHPHQQGEKSCPKKTLLIIDSCLKYAAEDIQTKSSGIIVEVIPKGATNKLHPLDIGVKSEFEQIVQEKWENRAESGKGYSRKNTLWGRRHAICFSMGGWCGKISNYMGHWCPTKSNYMGGWYFTAWKGKKEYYLPNKEVLSNLAKRKH